MLAGSDTSPSFLQKVDYLMVVEYQLNISNFKVKLLFDLLIPMFMLNVLLSQPLDPISLTMEHAILDFPH